ncbi:MAG: hypothetical protein ACLQOO_23325, partial [Terriglobia bacterium]
WQKARGKLATISPINFLSSTISVPMQLANALVSPVTACRQIARGRVALVMLSAGRPIVRRPLGWLPKRSDLAHSYKIGREKGRFYAVFCHFLAENGRIWYDSAQKVRPQNGPVFKFAFTARLKHG